MKPKWEEIYNLLKVKSIFINQFQKFAYQKWLVKPKHNLPFNSVDYTNDKDSIIYLLYSTKTKHIYIGETQNFKNRIQNEIRNAKKAYMSDSKDKNKYQNFEKYMANIGVESWSYLILKTLGKPRYATKQLRLQTEKAYIKILQPKLNVRYKTTF